VNRILELLSPAQTEVIQDSIGRVAGHDRDDERIEGRVISAPISPGVRAIDRMRTWLAVRHSLPAELLVVVGL
jgi:hypothetical protein